MPFSQSSTGRRILDLEFLLPKGSSVLPQCQIGIVFMSRKPMPRHLDPGLIDMILLIASGLILSKGVEGGRETRALAIGRLAVS